MPLTPTEEKLKDLYVEFGDYSPRRAQEAALWAMRGNASHGEILNTPPDTQTTHSGHPLDLAEIEKMLKQHSNANKGGD